MRVIMARIRALADEGRHLATRIALRRCVPGCLGVRNRGCTQIQHGRIRSPRILSGPFAAKARNGSRQIVRFVGQRAGGGGRLLAHRGILLGHPIHLVYRGVDHGHPGRLLLGAGGNGGDQAW